MYIDNIKYLESHRKEIQVEKKKKTRESSVDGESELTHSGDPSTTGEPLKWSALHWEAKVVGVRHFWLDPSRSQTSCNKKILRDRGDERFYKIEKLLGTIYLSGVVLYRWRW